MARQRQLRAAGCGSGRYGADVDPHGRSLCRDDLANRDISSFSRSGPEIAAEKQGHLQRTISESGFMEPYRQTVDEVLAALETDARSGLSQRQAQERLERYGRNELAARKAGTRMAEVSRPVHGCARHPAARRGADLRGAVAVRARLARCPTRRWRSSPSCCSTRSWATSSRRGRSRPWRRCARCRRRTPTSSATARGRASRRPSSCPATSSSSRRATPFPPTRG